MKIENAVWLETFDTKQVSEKFRVREFVVEWADESPQYPQFLKFQATQDRCESLDAFNDGDIVSIEFNLRGKKYDKRGETSYFNSLEAWRITKTGNVTVTPKAAAIPATPVTPLVHSTSVEVPDSDVDDLPF